MEFLNENITGPSGPKFVIIIIIFFILSSNLVSPKSQPRKGTVTQAGGVLI